MRLLGFDIHSESERGPRFSHDSALADGKLAQSTANRGIKREKLAF